MRFDRLRTMPGFVATLLSLVVVLAACVQLTPDLRPGDAVHVAFTSVDDLSAAQVTIEYDDARMSFAGVRLFDDSVLCQSYDGLGTVTVGLVAQERDRPLRGDVMSLYFVPHGAGGSPPVHIVTSTAYAFDESPVSLASPGATSTSTLPQEGICQGTEGLSTLGAQTTIGTTTTPLDLALEPSFADFRLGDATADGSIDVLDVLRILKIATEAIASPAAFEFYHSDLDSDGLVGTLDVLRVLDKAVDPTLAAELHLAPRPVSFAHVQRDGPILVNNVGNQALSGISFSATGGVSIAQLGAYGVSGHSAAYSVDVTGSWSNEAASFSTGAGGAIDVAIGNVAILIAGQSNAAGYGQPLSPAEAGIPQVRMFGNDYVWKQAYEPVDDETGQVDTVSIEDPFSPDHSFGVRLGKELHAATSTTYDGIGRYVYLIPSARQGSVVDGGASATWQPAANRLDRTTLFGSANYRAQTSAGSIGGSPYEAEGGPVSAIAWYQGESDASQAARRQAFISNTNAVMDAFAAELGGVPVLYVQLATNTAIEANNNFQSIRERQRLMEAGVPSVNAGLGSPQPRSGYHMVVAHDLPMTDSVHLSKAGQLVLAERLALAYREHVIGEAVDGTGPRLQSISQSGNSIKVDTTRTINDDDDYGGYFRVYLASDPSVEFAISQIRRDPGDATAVQITLSSTPSGSVLVVYKPPPNRTLDTQILDVVKDASTGLPLPAFGATVN